jgi:UDP-glucose:(heptosyl)LPS alpha-1,3-glucosyltransferase
MLSDDAARADWRRNALAFAGHADIYSNAERAADIILQERP